MAITITNKPNGITGSKSPFILEFTGEQDTGTIEIGSDSFDLIAGVNNDFYFSLNDYLIGLFDNDNLVDEFDYKANKTDESLFKSISITIKIGSDTETMNFKVFRGLKLIEPLNLLAYNGYPFCISNIVDNKIERQVLNLNNTTNIFTIQGFNNNRRSVEIDRTKQQVRLIKFLASGSWHYIGLANNNITYSSNYTEGEQIAVNENSQVNSILDNNDYTYNIKGLLLLNNKYKDICKLFKSKLCLTILMPFWGISSKKLSSL